MGMTNTASSTSNPIWFLLYSGSSCDGRGEPKYKSRTTDIDIAIKHLKAKPNPYCFDKVMAVTDTTCYEASHAGLIKLKSVLGKPSV